MNAETKAVIRAIMRESPDKRVFAGFDGYIDKILRIEGISRMEGFGRHILQKSGKSCSLNAELLEERIGGNMPNVAAALSALNVQVNCVGALGYPSVDKLFSDALTGCGLFSAAGYGTAVSYEFLDGKVMIAQNGEIDRLDYQTLISRLPEETIDRLLREADMLVFLNWSEMKQAASIWEGFAQFLLPKLTSRVPMLVDISDCSGKSREEMRSLMGVLKTFAKNLQLHVSLNLNEAEQLAVKIGLACKTPMEIAVSVQCALQARAIVVHLRNGCVYATAESTGFVQNRVIEKPKLLTGGGDNFNAGLSFGLLSGLELESALHTANAVSGYYVSHGTNPDREHLAAWLAAGSTA